MQEQVLCTKHSTKTIPRSSRESGSPGQIHCSANWLWN